MMFTLWHKRPRIDVKDSTLFFSAYGWHGQDRI